MTTLIIGASTNTERYSNKAAHHLAARNYEFVLLGLQKGEVLGHAILNGFPELDGIDTVTLYLNPQRQAEYYDYILRLKPRRIIFNPGTENAELVAIAEAEGIICIYACTLVLLATGNYA
jgi:predicted CoA-binding protein